MALLQVNFMARTLMRTVPVNVILPVDKLFTDQTGQPGTKPFKTLYLLHGILGNYTDWISGTCIQRWAEEKDLAVVMPSGDNMFYVDQPAAHNFYGEFIGKELVEMTRRMFPLSHKREDTFIAGLSMGGYGAIRNGLKYHETFSCIAGLSAANVVESLHTYNEDSPSFIHRKSFIQTALGSLDAVKGSDKDPIWLAEQLAVGKSAKPSIFLACGVDDGLLDINRKLHKDLTALGYTVTYEEGSGGHEWDFWNRTIKHVIDWLPLEDGKAGINSGNIGV